MKAPAMLLLLSAGFLLGGCGGGTTSSATSGEPPSSSVNSTANSSLEASSEASSLPEITSSSQAKEEESSSPIESLTSDDEPQSIEDQSSSKAWDNSDSSKASSGSKFSEEESFPVSEEESSEQSLEESSIEEESVSEIEESPEESLQSEEESSLEEESSEAESSLEEESSFEEESSSEEEVFYSVNASSSGKAVLHFPNDVNTFKAGDAVTFTVTPTVEGYQLSNFYFVDDENMNSYLYPDGEGVYSFTMPARNVTIYNSVTRMTRLSIITDSHVSIALDEGFEENAYFVSAASIGFTVTVEEGYSLNTLTYSGTSYASNSSLSGNATKSEEGENHYTIPAIDGDITLRATSLADVIDDGSDPWSKKGTDTVYQGQYSYYSYGTDYTMVLTIKVHPNATLDVDLTGYWYDDPWEDWYWLLPSGPSPRLAFYDGSRNYVDGKNVSFTYSTGQISFSCPYNQTSKTLALSLSSTLVSDVPASMTCLNDIAGEYYQTNSCQLNIVS